ncbi:MAG: hypothetical protein WBZ36_08030 [Candidatus Nitrosopolaris sp.]
MSRSRLKEYLLFNRNILIGFSGAFLTGAATSQAITRLSSPAVNSLISLVVETTVYLTIFGILFYLDNKHRFVNEQTQATESGKVKWVIIKLASTLSVAEIEYNTLKPFITFGCPALPSLHCFYNCKFYYDPRILRCSRFNGISYSFIQESIV